MKDPRVPPHFKAPKPSPNIGDERTQPYVHFHCKTPITQASEAGYTTVVARLLRDEHVDPAAIAPDYIKDWLDSDERSALDSYDNLPIWRAIENGHSAVVEPILLDTALLNEVIEAEGEGLEDDYAVSRLAETATQTGALAILKALHQYPAFHSFISSPFLWSCAVLKGALESAHFLQSITTDVEKAVGYLVDSLIEGYKDTRSFLPELTPAIAVFRSV